MRRSAALVTVIGATALAPVAAASDAGIEQLLRSASGSALTVSSVGRDQLLAAPNSLTAEQGAARRRGEAFFNTPFVPAPSAATLRDGLGPLFNSASCESCHNNLGRGQPPSAGGLPSTSVVVQFSWRDEAGRWRPHPTYGSNLNPLAIDGVVAEGQLHVEYETVQGRYADGTEWTIRRPRHTIVDLAYGPLDGNTRFSPRMTPPVIGMGLLEAVPEASVLALADPEDHDGDGISGRPNWIVGADGRTRLGRFGWKANQPDVRAQTVAAFNAEQGITSPDLPTSGCTTVQTACLSRPNGGTPEIGEQDLQTLLLFMQTAPVPARRDLALPTVRRGATVFLQARCAACHVPTLTTADAPLRVLADQQIHAFTDLLLHDMGPGLADGRPDHEASGSEWRTPPLWGLGRAAEIGTQPAYLHDGRARSLAEAVLWHAGEAERSRQAFIALSSADREALLTFLNSL
jgi:CxxC motif-containing protein (DUF1111 family)